MSSREEKATLSDPSTPSGHPTNRLPPPPPLALYEPHTSTSPPVERPRSSKEGHEAMRRQEEDIWQVELGGGRLSPRTWEGRKEVCVRQG